MVNPNKTAVVLFNLGGPDKLSAVKPFLFNLFNDPAIISLPNPFRFLLAKFISSRRTKTASEIYSLIGGKSPILEETTLQAQALEKSLKTEGNFKVFISMRYWKPFIRDVIDDVEKFQPDEIILLPLYPQFSTTTTASSFKHWSDNVGDKFKGIPVKSPCCYYDNDKFLSSYANLITDKYSEAERTGKPRLIFSAHGIPLNRIKEGDPYQYQIGQTAKGIIAKLRIKDLDSIVCYQSKVGPLEWLSPSTENEIKRAAKDRVPIVIAPIAFVSEHSETLVELDIEYRELAEEHGLHNYFRVPAVTADKLFIECLREQVLNFQPRNCGFTKCGQYKVA